MLCKDGYDPGRANRESQANEAIKHPNLNAYSREQKHFHRLSPAALNLSMDPMAVQLPRSVLFPRPFELVLITRDYSLCQSLPGGPTSHLGRATAYSNDHPGL